MKKSNTVTAIALALATALLVTGCATTAAVNELKRQNALLQKRLKRMQKRVYGKKRASAKTSDARPRPLPLPRPMGPAGLAAIHPATADQMVGLPENVGFVNRSPVCENQPNLWNIHNYSRAWLKVSINGVPLVVVDDPEVRQLGLIPPNTTVKVCVTLKYRGVYGPETTATLTAVKHTAPNPVPTPLPGLIKQTVPFGKSETGMYTKIR